MSHDVKGAKSAAEVSIIDHSFPPPMSQGPCVKNQEALASSRLWDAVSGFLQIFALLERKLYKDTSQMELLRELLSLQEEMYILLLSMLEGRNHMTVM